MTEKEAIKQLKDDLDDPFGGYITFDACDLAIKALEAQIKLKEYIERLNQPEYNGIVWQKDEVVLLLKELLAEQGGTKDDNNKR